MKQYNERYDAYYDDETNEWLESKCDDPECEYCVGRPERPPFDKNQARTVIALMKTILAREYRMNLQQDNSMIQVLRENYEKEFQSIQQLEDYINA